MLHYGSVAPCFAMILQRGSSSGVQEVHVELLQVICHVAEPSWTYVGIRLLDRLYYPSIMHCNFICGLSDVIIKTFSQSVCNRKYTTERCSTYGCWMQENTEREGRTGVWSNRQIPRRVVSLCAIILLMLSVKKINNQQINKLIKKQIFKKQPNKFINQSINQSINTIVLTTISQCYIHAR